MKKILLLLSFAATVHIAHAQVTRQHTNNFNTWLVYNGDHKFTTKWGVHIEAQFRRNDFVENPQQLLLRTGINYHISNQLFVTAGYCFVETSPYGSFAVKTSYPEHRLWEQLQLKEQVGKTELVSRLRLEQRWMDLPVLKEGKYMPGEAVYQNRVRLFNRLSVPFKGKTIIDKSFYATAYDEAMLNFGKKVGYNVFDQNRACVALGYKIPKAGRLEIGYLNQTIMKPDGVRIERNHTLQIGLYSNLDFYKKKA